MRLITLLLAGVALSACASTPIPPLAEGQVRVSLSYHPGQLLMAETLDEQRWPDGRYFDLAPGAHTLESKLIFERPSGGSLGQESEPVQVTCHYRLHYADFAAGQRYRLHGQVQGWRGYVRLYDETGQILARAKELRCGAF